MYVPGGAGLLITIYRRVRLLVTPTHLLLYVLMTSHFECIAVLLRTGRAGIRIKLEFLESPDKALYTVA
jgi:hypothetical protein